ncbi:MAG: TetR/AcrR family transcriptional regulator [Alphaproteobacteria bacterium]
MMAKQDKKEVILEAAQKCFVEKGYDGTSLRDIAKQANVPAGLVYYYFKDKDALWLDTKMHMVKSVLNDDVLNNTPDDSLKNFLRYVMTQRFNMYKSNPDLARLMLWQILEGSVSGIPALHPWRDIIKTLQERGDMRTDISAEDVFTFILTTSSSVFMSYSEPLDNPEEYLEMMMKVLQQGLAPSY